MMLIIVAGLIVLTGVFMSALSIPALMVSPAGSSIERVSILDGWLTDLYKKGKFSGSVLLAKDGRIVFNRSYGFQDLKGLTLLSDNSSYNLASVSKQFTAMAVVILQHRGQLSYGDKLSQYIPELAAYQDVTIEHLLHHTSGIPDYMYLANKYLDMSKIVTTESLLQLFENKQPAQLFKAGSKFKYSNTGYVLLAEIVERLSGESFADFMTKNIFQPAGMTDTRLFNLLSESPLKNRVYGFGRAYNIFGGKKKEMDLNNFDGLFGDGAIYSTPIDLFRWHLALTEGKIVAKDSYLPAYRSGKLSNGSETGYGYGWFIKDRHTVEHAGGWQGFTSYIHINREKNKLVVILDNSNNPLRVNAVGTRYNSIGLNLQKMISSWPSESDIEI